MSSSKHGEEFKKQISEIFYEIYSLVSTAKGQCNENDTSQLLDTSRKIADKATVVINITKDWKLKKVLSGT
jgi:methionyl-tRNA synthetase